MEEVDSNIPVVLDLISPELPLLVQPPSPAHPSYHPWALPFPSELGKYIIYTKTSMITILNYICPGPVITPPVVACAGPDTAAEFL